MTRIERMKQKAILDVAESLGYSFKHLSGQVYEHPEHDSFEFLRTPIPLNGFHVTYREM